MPANMRPLHFVFKICNRSKTMDFYRNLLKMSILRHEEFEEGCEASCNGPYDGKWSKTMVGYGPEDNHFVVELTYNYGIRSYELGNDFNYLKIASNEVIENIKSKNYPHEVRSDQSYEIVDPNGYKFLVTANTPANPVNCMIASSLYITNVEKSAEYWSGHLKAKIESRTSENLVLSFDNGQFRLDLVKSSVDNIDHAKAFGRIAFACPASELLPLQELIEKNNQTVLTKYVELKTPGKADVCVVILADTDGHEICFVGDEGFKELSQVDPKAVELLDEAMDKDKSDLWHEKKAKKNQN